MLLHLSLYMSLVVCENSLTQGITASESVFYQPFFSLICHICSLNNSLLNLDQVFNTL
jgi:hypothetical protein